MEIYSIFFRMNEYWIVFETKKPEITDSNVIHLKCVYFSFSIFNVYSIQKCTISIENGIVSFKDKEYDILSHSAWFLIKIFHWKSIKLLIMQWCHWLKSFFRRRWPFENIHVICFLVLLKFHSLVRSTYFSLFFGLFLHLLICAQNEPINGRA